MQARTESPERGKPSGARPVAAPRAGGRRALPPRASSIAASASPVTLEVSCDRTLRRQLGHLVGLGCDLLGHRDDPRPRLVGAVGHERRIGRRDPRPRARRVADGRPPSHAPPRPRPRRTGRPARSARLRAAPVSAVAAPLAGASVRSPSAARSSPTRSSFSMGAEEVDRLAARAACCRG